MRYLLYFLVGLLSVNALIGGFMMMIKPDGSLLQLNLNFLSKSPFANYFFPGIFLFIFIGLLSFISFSGLVFKFNWKIAERLNIYSNRHWAWAHSLYTGIITIIWIAVQLLVTDYFWLQPVIIFIAVGILICTLSPGVMKHYEI
ncbi:MAG: hypothetical protein HOP11_00325 [Saprospiraceae bacterium]|nr:hypothetical protein [Saprospiraceae bacterium]